MTKGRCHAWYFVLPQSVGLLIITRMRLLSLSSPMRRKRAPWFLDRGHVSWIVSPRGMPPLADEARLKIQRGGHPGLGGCQLQWQVLKTENQGKLGRCVDEAEPRGIGLQAKERQELATTWQKRGLECSAAEPPGEATQTTPWFQTPSMQNCQRVHYCHFKSLGFWKFVTPALANRLHGPQRAGVGMWRGLCVFTITQVPQQDQTWDFEDFTQMAMTIDPSFVWNLHHHAKSLIDHHLYMLLCW